MVVVQAGLHCSGAVPMPSACNQHLADSRHHAISNQCNQGVKALARPASLKNHTLRADKTLRPASTRAGQGVWLQSSASTSPAPCIKHHTGPQCWQRSESISTARSREAGTNQIGPRCTTAGSLRLPVTHKRQQLGCTSQPRTRSPAPALSRQEASGRAPQEQVLSR